MSRAVLLRSLSVTIVSTGTERMASHRPRARYHGILRPLWAHGLNVAGTTWWPALLLAARGPLGERLVALQMQMRTTE